MYFTKITFYYFPSGLVLERTGMVKHIHLLFRKLLKSKSVNGKDLSLEQLYDLEENGSALQYKKVEEEIKHINDLKIVKEKSNNSKINNNENSYMNLNKSINNNNLENNDDNKCDSDDNKGNKDKFEYQENDSKTNSTGGLKGEEQLAMVRYQRIYIHFILFILF